MNEQQLLELYKIINPSISFEEFKAEMSDPIYRAFVTSKYSQEEVPPSTEVPAPKTQEQASMEWGAQRFGPPPEKNIPTPEVKPMTYEETLRVNPDLQNEFTQEVQRPLRENAPAEDIVSKVSNLQGIYIKSIEKNQQLSAQRLNDFVKSRLKEYQGAIKTEKDKETVYNLILKEAEVFKQNEIERIAATTKPFYEEYSKVFNSQMNQMAMTNPEMANAYYNNLQRSYSEYSPSQRILLNLSTAPFVTSALSTMGDIIPGMWAAAQAANVESYEDYLLQKYFSESDYPGAAFAQKLQGENIKNELVQKEIKRVGQEQFNRNKAEFDKANAAYRKMQLDYANQQQGEAAGSMARFAPTWEESSGPGGLSEYLQKSLGNVVGFALPTVAAGAVIGAATEGTGLPTYATSVLGAIAASPLMYQVEKGSSYVESIDALKQKYPDLSTEQILQQNLDKDYRDAAVKAGIVNAALEQISNVTMVGKYIPKSVVANFVEKLLVSRGGRMTIGATIEGTTEWAQRKSTRYFQYKADGLSDTDAMNKALSFDDSEEFIAGLTGGGGMSLISSFFQDKKKAQAEAVVSSISTGNPQLDQAIDNQARETELSSPPVGDVRYGQTGEAEVSGGEQQGAQQSQDETKARIVELQSLLADDAASLQETGTGNLQPEARKQVQDELNSLLEQQVSPETPGQAGQEVAQEEVGDVTVGELLDKSGVYQGKKGLFYKDPEGQAILFKPENENRIYELGNIDEISNKPISEFGVEYTESVVGTTDNGNFTVRSKEYLNKYSNPLMAINQDRAGNIVSVNLETTDGKKRTFRGNIAEDLAYQIKLKQITDNNEQLNRFEEFINSPEVSSEISGLPEVAPQAQTGTNQQVPTTQPTGQVTPTIGTPQLGIRRISVAPQDQGGTSQIEAKKAEITRLEQEREALLKQSGGGSIVDQIKADLSSLSGYQANTRTEATRKLINAWLKIYDLGPYTGSMEDSDAYYKAIKDADSYSAPLLLFNLNNLDKAKAELVKHAQDIRGKESVQVNTSAIDAKIKQAREELTTLQSAKAPTVTTTPVEGVTPKAQSRFQKGQELFVVKDGQIMPVTYQGVSTSGRSASVQMSNGNRISVNPNDLFDNEQAALDFMEAPEAKAPQTTPEVTTEEQAQEDPLVIESEKELEDLFGPPSPPQVTAPEITTPTQEAAAPEATTETTTETAPEQAPAALEPLTKVEENKIKRYFWNKNSKAFADLGTALSMSRESWKGVARRFYKTATPKEKAMLEKLVGADTFTKAEKEKKTEEATQQEAERVVVTLADDKILSDNGYSEKQIQMVYDNPTKYAQIDNNIVDLETNNIVKPEGVKKQPVRKRRRPTPTEKTYPKKSLKDLEDLLYNLSIGTSKEGHVKQILETIVGMDNRFSDMAIQLLKILPENKIAKTSVVVKEGDPKDKNKHAIYYSDVNALVFNQEVIRIGASEEVLNQIQNNKEFAGKQYTPFFLEYLEYELSRLAIHEIVHAFTVSNLLSAMPSLASLKDKIDPYSSEFRVAEREVLNAYLKNGKDENIKDIIRLYNHATDEIFLLNRAVSNKEVTDEATISILNEAKGYEAYGLKNIFEFFTESFSNGKFQRLLNLIDSPVQPKGKVRKLWDDFVEAVRNILRVVDDAGKRMRPRVGSVLESIIMVTPEFMTSTFKPITKVGKRNIGLAAETPNTQQKVTAAVTKMAQGLINSGKATKDNVIDKVKERITGKFNIDIDAIAQDVLDSVTEKPGRTTAPVTGKTDTQTLLDQFNQDVNRRSMGIGQESKAFAMGAKAEKVADFLRGKITNREELDAFVDAWNQSLTPLPDTGKVNPDAYLKAADTNRAWDLIKPGKATEAEKVASIGEVLQAQWDARARGIAQGVRQTTKAFRDNLLKSLQEAIQQTPSLSKAQINQMIAAVKRVNFFTAGSISKLKNKIEILQNNAEQAAKEAKARQLQKTLRSLAKREAKSALALYRELAVNFLSVDTDYLRNDDLDKYIQEASAIEAAFASGSKYKPVSEDNIQDYINDQLKYKEEKQLEELDFRESKELQMAIDGVSLDNLNSILKELKDEEKKQVLLERATELKEELQNNNDKEIKELRNANLSDLTMDELMMFIRIADNVLLNEDNSSVARFSTEVLQKRERMKTLFQNLPAKAFEVSSELYREIGLQTVQLIDNIYRNKDAALRFFYPETGISAYNDGTKNTEEETNKVNKKIEDKIEQIDAKYSGGFVGKRNQKELRSRTENAKLLILSELAKFVSDPSEHIEKVHNNIKRSIDLLLYGRDPEAKESARTQGIDVEFGQELQKIYDKYKDVKTADEAIALFKNKDPHVHELWSFISTEIFTPEFQKRLADNTRSVHGKVFVVSQNYMPTALKFLGLTAIDEATDNPKLLFKSVKPKPADSTKEANRKMNTGQIYDFENYINRVSNSYSNTAKDINTSEALLLFSSIVRDPKFDTLVGGLKNAMAIVSHMAGINKMENEIGADSAALEAFNAVGDSIATLGSVSALGGLDQAPLQYVAGAASAMFNLGYDAGLFWAAPSDISRIKNPAFFESVKKILQKKGIAIRGAQHKMDLATRHFDFAERSRILKAFTKSRKANRFLQRALLGTLSYSDVSVAERAFIAFYLQALKREGVNIKAVDLSQESELADTPERRRALAYADGMVDTLMVSSTGAGRTKFASKKGAFAVGRKMLFPFVTFPINLKIRVIEAARKVKSNPKEGAKELAAALTEVMVFNGVRTYLLSMYYGGLYTLGTSLLGYDEEDDDEKVNKTKKWATSVMLDMLPLPNIGVMNEAVNPAINYLNYKLSPTEAKTLNQFMKEKDKDLEPLWEKKIDYSKYNQFSEFGQYGIGLERMADMIGSVRNLTGDYVIINEGSEFEKLIEKKGDEYNDLLWLNVANQWLPLPRELRTTGKRIYREQMRSNNRRRRNRSNPMDDMIIY